MIGTTLASNSSSQDTLRNSPSVTDSQTPSEDNTSTEKSLKELLSIINPTHNYLTEANRKIGNDLLDLKWQKLTEVIPPEKNPGVDESNQTWDNRKENSIRDQTASQIQLRSPKLTTYAEITRISNERNPTLLLYPAMESGKIESIKVSDWLKIVFFDEIIKKLFMT
ncbi:hypothetical protein AVEN_93853-1 [Araneus ventricosus]|uniref:Uncharacterized protein n=1 Tax=Araneus ventricosus TaxID=182803 RepID=A0A4Y2B183_ARAVE|nr:hypothetical protein AVEN_93853-1 [Araneus ventricosus]